MGLIVFVYSHGAFLKQDTETGIDVCKLSEKNFLRTSGPEQGHHLKSQRS